MRNRFSNSIFERAVAIVKVETIFALKVITNIEIAIAIEINV